ncbi:hypothetical protein KY328_04815 [Candidatus Woesearchaeota archaeon]|nr:hypothetical protein [Candidatus Woesearchaeota archaeon]MBW3022220.1 hypothetical protein [Candidatus Woesearchaeota archaeon]
MAKKDLLRRSVLIGIGLGAITKEKVERYVKDLRKEGYLDVEEGKKLARDMLSEGKRMEKKLKQHLKKRISMAKKIKAQYKKKKTSKKPKPKRHVKKKKSKPKKKRR